MNAWKISGDNYEVVLLEQYINNSTKGEKEPFLKSEHLKALIADINKKEDVFLFIDMNGIFKTASRVFAFLAEKEILNRILFFNIEKGEVGDNLYEDLHGNSGEIHQMRFVYFSEEASSVSFRLFRRRDPRALVFRGVLRSLCVVRTDLV